MAAGRKEGRKELKTELMTSPSPCSSTLSDCSPVDMPDRISFEFNAAMQGTSAELLVCVPHFCLMTALYREPNAHYASARRS